MLSRMKLLLFHRIYKSIIFQHSFMLNGNTTKSHYTKEKKKKRRRWTLCCSKMCKNCCFFKKLLSLPPVSSSSFVSFNLFHTLIEWWISFNECEKEFSFQMYFCKFSWNMIFIKLLQKIFSNYRTKSVTYVHPYRLIRYIRFFVST